MLASVPKPTGHYLCFCNGDAYPVFYPHFYGMFDTTRCLVRDKTHFGLGRIWRHQHELIISARWHSSEFSGEAETQSDILRFKATPTAKRQHPVEKPAAMLASLIESTCSLGSTVLDPFTGSGTLEDCCSNGDVRR